MSDSELRKAQNIMLNILIQVAEICERHNLTYCLDGGTLLGAVRHKGFIPWDDDIDITMPRNDYEKFKIIAEKELSNDLFIQYTAKEPDFEIPWIKIRKNNTTLIETGESGDENYHHGIFIDIFPFDHYDSTFFIKWMNWTRTVRDRKKRYKRGTFKRLITTIYTNIILGIPVKISKVYYNYLVRNKKFWNNTEGQYYTFGLECSPVCLTKVEDYFPTKIVAEIFEGHDFRMPNKPENILRAYYGDTYMQLPPKDQQKVHSKKIVV